MKILLIGYGKMGKLIHELAEKRGHEIVKIIDLDNESDLDDTQSLRSIHADVAIEFTQPESAVKHLKGCMDAGIPVVCGTTGWYSQLATVSDYCLEHKGALLYASNFSIGVQLFWSLAKNLGRLMAAFPEYQPLIEEWHHIHKLDAPSGTAITTAEKILEALPQYQGWHRVEDSMEVSSSIPIRSYRENEIPGTHTITFTSGIDRIKLEHEAFSRQGFVAGALLAAEWLCGKRGIFTIDDLLAAKS